MQQLLRVETAGLQIMASRWGALVGELNGTIAPAGLGLSCQASAAAVNAAGSDIKGFVTTLAAKVAARATKVMEADTGYAANETSSANQLAALAEPVTDA
jgi:hypothetical protein